MTVVHETAAPLRVAVLGAGPIGLEAALYGLSLGYDVAVFDRGEVAQAVKSWGHVRMFSPWSMNTTPLGARHLTDAGYSLPTGEHCPTGEEFVERYLLPLSRHPQLAPRLRLHTRIIEVGRDGLLKGDQIGLPGRGHHPFRLLLENRSGEHIEHADVVLDCTGTYGCPNAIGDGGIPAPGERWLVDRLVRHIPDVLGKDAARFTRRRTLVVGSGMSAATAVCELAQLCRRAPATEVLWAARQDRAEPYALIDNDAIPARAELMAAANELAVSGASGRGPLRFLAGTVVEGLSAEGHRVRVTLRRAGGHFQDELVDEVVGLTGYGPDNSLYRELQVHECYASRGPMRLAAALLQQDGGGDCLAAPVPGPETLRNPEPRFFLLGSKSFGRNSTFLLKKGHQQVRDVYALLREDPALDLYA